jgi:hypothetical protein
MSSLLQAILPPPYHLINVFLQIANKLGYKKKKNVQQPLLSNNFAKKHVYTATIALQQRNDVFYAVRVEIL